MDFYLFIPRKIAQSWRHDACSIQRVANVSQYIFAHAQLERWVVTIDTEYSSGTQRVQNIRMIGLPLQINPQLNITQNNFCNSNDCFAEIWRLIVNMSTMALWNIAQILPFDVRFDRDWVCLLSVDGWPGERVPEGGDAEVDQHEVHLQGQGIATPPPSSRTTWHQWSRTETKTLPGIWVLVKCVTFRKYSGDLNYIQSKNGTIQIMDFIIAGSPLLNNNLLFKPSVTQLMTWMMNF